MWLRFYDWMLSGKGPEIPEDDIINDDDELDEYLEQWKKKIKEEMHERKKQTSSSGKKQGPHKSFSIG
jgi:hypothetical protein